MGDSAVPFLQDPAHTMGGLQVERRPKVRCTRLRCRGFSAGDVLPPHHPGCTREQHWRLESMEHGRSAHSLLHDLLVRYFPRTLRDRRDERYWKKERGQKKNNDTNQSDL